MLTSPENGLQYLAMYNVKSAHPGDPKRELQFFQFINKGTSSFQDKRQ
jgi:hypothetical protein